MKQIDKSGQEQNQILPEWFLHPIIHSYKPQNNHVNAYEAVGPRFAFFGWRKKVIQFCKCDKLKD